MWGFLGLYGVVQYLTHGYASLADPEFQSYAGFYLFLMLAIFLSIAIARFIYRRNGKLGLEE